MLRAGDYWGVQRVLDDVRGGMGSMLDFRFEGPMPPHEISAVFDRLTSNLSKAVTLAKEIRDEVGIG